MANIIEELDLADIQRERHPKAKGFTWQKRYPLQQTRLTFFLIAETLAGEVTSARIEPSWRSDHFPIMISLQLGKGHGNYMTFWKLNKCLLKDEEYIQLAKQTKEYAALPYCQ